MVSRKSASPPGGRKREGPSPGWAKTATRAWSPKAIGPGRRRALPEVRHPRSGPAPLRNRGHLPQHRNPILEFDVTLESECRTPRGAGALRRSRGNGASLHWDAAVGDCPATPCAHDSPFERFSAGMSEIDSRVPQFASAWCCVSAMMRCSVIPSINSTGRVLTNDFASSVNDPEVTTAPPYAPSAAMTP